MSRRKSNMDQSKKIYIYNCCNGNCVDQVKYVTVSRYQKCCNPLSLKNLCLRRLYENITCHNALDLLITASKLGTWMLREYSLGHIWSNRSNIVMKTSWKELEKSCPKFFIEGLTLMMDVMDYKIYNGEYWIKYNFIDNLTLEDICIITLGKGLTKDNALNILYHSNRLNAKKLVKKCIEFVLHNRHSRVIKDTWKFLHKNKQTVFIEVAKVMLEINE